MNNEEYIGSIVEGLEETLRDYTFNNYKKQIISWNLSQSFNRTYKEEYLWNHILYLSTNASILLNENQNRRLAIRSLKESAEVYETLHYISEKYDKEYCLVLSALCYDLAGYQANAFCLIRKLGDYQFDTRDERIQISSANYILTHIRQILLKKYS